MPRVTAASPSLARAFKAAYAAKPTLLFDIDGVLSFLGENICAALNARFGATYAPADMRRYWSESWLPPDQGAWLSEQFQSPAFYATAAPDFRGIDALNRLYQQSYRVIIASDRPAAVAAGTLRWLRQYGVSYDGIRLEGPGSKEAVADAYGEGDALVVIDDDPGKWLLMPRPGVEVWSPRRPWTPNEVGLYNVRVFDNWSQTAVWLAETAA